MSWSDIPGRAAYTWIYDAFLAVAPKNAIIVEVGVALGKSLAYCASKAIEIGRDDIEIIAVDSWAGVARNGEQQADGPPTPDGDWELFNRTMGLHCPKELQRISIVRRDSLAAARKLARRKSRPSLVVLDADHTLEAVTADIHAWQSLMGPDGWIGGDDYMPEYQGVIDAVGKYFPSSEVEVRHDQGWGTWLVRGVR
jgi:cephalosporin hydroxylase